MAFFRVLFGLLLLASLLCFAVALFTGQPQWRRHGVLLLKWTLLSAAGFFAVLVVQRLTEML